MSTQDRTVLSRRRALKSGGFAAIAAGLIGATKPAEAAPAAPLAVASLVDLSALTAESLRLVAICHESQKASLAARKELATHLKPEQNHLVSAFIDDFEGTRHGDFLSLIQSELCRHLPGLAPALYLIFDHVMETNYDNFGRCCVDAPPSE